LAPLGSKESILSFRARECPHCMLKYFKRSIKTILWFLEIFPMLYAYSEVVSFGKLERFAPYGSCSTAGHTKSKI